MKTFKIKAIGMLMIILFLTAGCEKWIDPEINVDPNNPEDVTMNLLLPSTQAGIAFQMGGDFKYAMSMWIQHLSGVSRQALQYEKYRYSEADVNNVWSYGLYSGPLMNLKLMLDKSQDPEGIYYRGVAKVLLAFTLGNMTDVWDKIPYSEAFQGNDNLKPTYDTQEAIYNEIFKLLNEAITELGTPSASIPNVINIKGDLMYGNNSHAKWLKAAYALKARYKLHLVNRKGAGFWTSDVLPAITDALDPAVGKFGSNSDDMEFKFGTSTNEYNPLHQFNIQRGDIRIGAFIVDTMLATGDPRLAKFADLDANNGYSGSPAGSATLSASKVGSYYASNNSPVPFISYVELRFIEAEVKFVTGDLNGAATAYNTAVKASLAKFGVTDAVWEGNYANEDQSTITHEKIMMGKYIALFLSTESFVDWRRTGIPSLSPAQQNFNNNVIPRRYPYPTSEKSTNAENVPAVTISQSVWWDL